MDESSSCFELPNNATSDKCGVMTMKTEIIGHEHIQFTKSLPAGVKNIQWVFCFLCNSNVSL